MMELQRIVGRNWIRLYSGKLRPRVILNALDWAKLPRPKTAPLDQLSWNKLAYMTVEAYKKVVDA